MDDEDFKRTVLDYFEIATQRDLRTMAQAADILAKITTALTTIETVKANLDKVLTDYSATAPAGHAAVLDTLVAPIDEVVTKVAALGTEFETKIKALPVPGATPPA